MILAEILLVVFLSRLSLIVLKRDIIRFSDGLIY